MSAGRPSPGKPTQLLFDEDMELERQEEEDQKKRRTAQIRRREAQEAKRKARLLRIRIGIMAATIVLLGGVYSLRFFGVYPFAIPVRRLSAEQIQTVARQWVVFAVEEIEAYRAKQGQPPRDLREINVGSTGEWTYTVLAGGRYQIGVSYKGASASFDSVNDPKQFLASARKR